jgi:UDP-N-acetylglucosamine 2-epimerase (non-hydrolysing)
MRLCFVVGTAAELIKIYPLMVEADERGFPWSLLSTGQSPVNLSKQYDDFGLNRAKFIQPVETTSDLKTSMQALVWFVRAWFAKPAMTIPKGTDVVVVHGDTLSTVIGARWGRKVSLPIVHVEAGLRSGKLFSPFPEEINRRIVTRWASLHMAQDDQAAENLHRLGYEQGVFSTGGNTLADTVRLILQKHPPAEKKEAYVVANLHRYENLNNRRRWMFLIEAVARAAQKTKVIFVMHPQTQHKLEYDPGLTEKLQKAGVVLEKRLPFTKFIRLLAQADYVISDGGSNQEECFYLGVPCLILRDTTERSEGLHSNCCLSKFDAEAMEDFISDAQRWRRPAATPSWSPSGLIMDTLVRTLAPSLTSHNP